MRSLPVRRASWTAFKLTTSVSWLGYSPPLRKLEAEGADDDEELLLCSGVVAEAAAALIDDDDDEEVALQAGELSLWSRKQRTLQYATSHVGQRYFEAQVLQIAHGAVGREEERSTSGTVKDRLHRMLGRRISRPLVLLMDAFLRYRLLHGRTCLAGV